jgi:hypothetical protein
MTDEDAQTAAAVEILQNALKELADAYTEALCCRKQQLKLESEYEELAEKHKVNELTRDLQRQDFRRSRLKIDDLLGKITRHRRIFTRKLNQLTT